MFNYMSLRVFLVSILIQLFASPAGWAEDSQEESRGADVATRVGLPTGCLTESYFREFSVGHASFELGFYHREIEGIPVLGSGTPILFGHEEIAYKKPDCDSIWAPTQGLQQDPCQQDRDCTRSARVLVQGAGGELVSAFAVLEKNSVRREDIQQRADLGASIQEGADAWYYSIYSDYLSRPVSRSLPLSLSSSLCQSAPFAPVARRKDNGFDWRLVPVENTLMKTRPQLAASGPGCMQVGSGNLSVILERDRPYLRVTTLLDPTTPVAFDFKDNEPWILEEPEDPWGERRLAANIFMQSIYVMRKIEEIFPWLVDFLGSEEYPILINQSYGSPAGGCKATWSPSEIFLPLFCPYSDAFNAKGLCSDIIAHEIAHDWLSRILLLSTGRGKYRFEDDLLWEGMADYLSLVLVNSSDGIFGAFCGSDIRSLRLGLYSDKLFPRRPYDVAIFEAGSSQSSLTISSALWIIREKLVEELKLSDVLVDAWDQLVVLAVILNGHTTESFASNLVNLSEIAMPEEVRRLICGVFKHSSFRIPALGCDPQRASMVDNFCIPVLGCEAERASTIESTFRPDGAFVVETDSHSLQSAVGESFTSPSATPRLSAQIQRIELEDTVDQVQLVSPGGKTWIVTNDSSSQMRFFSIEGEDLLEKFTEKSTDAPFGFSIEDSGQVRVPLDNKKTAVFDLQKEKMSLVREQGLLLEIGDFEAGRFRGYQHPNGQEISIGVSRDIDPRTVLIEYYGKKPTMTAKILGSTAVRKFQLRGGRYTEPDGAPSFLVNPPTVLWEENYPALVFRESRCLARPYITEIDGWRAALTCDGYLKILSRAGKLTVEQDFGRVAPHVNHPLTKGDVDCDGQMELLVGPLVAPSSSGSLYEVFALELDGSKPLEKWPIRSSVEPTVPLSFDSGNDGKTPRLVISGASMIEVWTLGRSLDTCR